MSAINVITRTLGLLAVFALAAASARGQDPPARPAIDPQQVFDRADADGDGKVSKQEFQLVAANAPRLRDDPQLADRVFGRLDADRDGSLSPAEFRRLATMRSGSPAGRPPAPAARAPEKAPEKSADKPPTADQVAFFEKKVRPVLVQHCYECHSARAKKAKGGLLLLSAFDEAYRQRPDLRLTIVGDERSRSFVGDRPGVTLHAHLPWEKLQQLYRESTLLVQPMLNDPWGQVYLEAMVSRTPVMGLNRNGLPELVDGGRHGFLVDRADPSALAEAIVSAVSDPKRLESMAAAAQRHVLHNYSWGRVAERIAYSP